MICTSHRAVPMHTSLRQSSSRWLLPCCVVPVLAHAVMTCVSGNSVIRKSATLYVSSPHSGRLKVVGCDSLRIDRRHARYSERFARPFQSNWHPHRILRSVQSDMLSVWCCKSLQIAAVTASDFFIVQLNIWLVFLHQTLRRPLRERLFICSSGQSANTVYLFHRSPKS